MNGKVFFIVCFVSFFLLACGSSKKLSKATEVTKSTSVVMNPKAKTFKQLIVLNRNELVAFAKTLLGTPYKYGSANPKNGLDCSGFIQYVFTHFNVKTPRTSVDFTNEGATIFYEDAQPGDLILFTGSDNSTGIVGHMGIITAGGKVPQFIHSTSGKNVGVIINNFTGYYKTHFVKVIRIIQ
ncbi:C40 family peptidase [Ferruginibacter yonginensis]|uniref:C40 family peptidase n=1 Tax=Ferruginibacter yonginensis TaxID=1310416 RepID=A0ABV8QTG6_9BACT